MNVLVTGSASRFAQVLLPRLLAEPQIELVIGVDRNQGEFTHERFVQVLMDPHSPQLERVLHGMQAVINLSALGYAEPAPEEREDAHASMLRDTQNLCTLAAGAGVAHLLHLSSALVYDARGTAGGVREDQARGAPGECGVARALQAVEDWLDGFEREHRGLRVVRLRPHWILGPRTASLLARLLALRLRPRLPEPSPLTQCVHEDDVAEATWLALTGRVSGAVNLACADALPLRDMQRAARRLALPMPPKLVARRLEAPETGCLENLLRGLVLDSTRARTELGWRPRYDKARDILRRL